MELWTVGNKTIVLFFVIIASYFTATEPDLWLVLFILIYLALNLILHIMKSSAIKQVMIMLIIIYLVSCSIYIQPYFALLLPLSSYELASFYTRSNGYLLCAIALPTLFLRSTMLVVYSFVTLLSFFNYIMVRKYMTRVSNQDDKLDRMRKDGQHLVKRLNDNQEFLKVSEYTAKLEERNRLAQELHDGIGHSMTGSLIQMEAAKRLINSDPQTAELLLQNAIGISKEGIEEIRLTLKNNKPPVEQLGFSRLRTTVEAFSAKTGLMTTVVHEGDIEMITPLQWRIIYENVNESLTNAAKYARASAVHIEIKVLNHFIKAVVSDNGQGSSKIVKGLGLIGMEERAAAVNGTIIADGSNGFSVTTLIPYGI